MKFKTREEILSALSPVADKEGVELVDIELKISKNPSITVFVDTEDGVDLDTLERFHNAIDPVLDEVDPSYGAAYTLNVSSPGLDRPFKTDRDYERHLGEDVEVKLFAPIKGVKNFDGKLVGYDGKNATIETEKETMVLPLNKIAKISVAIKFD